MKKLLIIAAMGCVGLTAKAQVYTFKYATDSMGEWVIRDSNMYLENYQQSIDSISIPDCEMSKQKLYTLLALKADSIDKVVIKKIKNVNALTKQTASLKSIETLTVKGMEIARLQGIVYALYYVMQEME